MMTSWAAAVCLAALFPTCVIAGDLPTLRLAVPGETSQTKHQQRLAQRLMAENLALMRHAVDQEHSGQTARGSAIPLFFKLMAPHAVQGGGYRFAYLAQHADLSFECGAVLVGMPDQLVSLDRHRFSPQVLRSPSARKNLVRMGCMPGL